MTDLFLVRHAPGKKDGNDAQRAVSKRGRLRLERLVRALRRLGVRFDALHHGSALRSLETANALCVVLDGPSRVTGAADDAADLLRGSETGRVAIVGGGSELIALGTRLVQGDAGGAAAFALKPTGVAWLVGEPAWGQMRLRALLSPRIVRALAAVHR